MNDNDLTQKIDHIQDSLKEVQKEIFAFAIIESRRGQINSSDNLLKSSQTIRKVSQTIREVWETLHEKTLY